jgi:hypothetical protein
MYFISLSLVITNFSLFWTVFRGHTALSRNRSIFDTSNLLPMPTSWFVNSSLVLSCWNN